MKLKRQSKKPPEISEEESEDAEEMKTINLMKQFILLVVVQSIYVLYIKLNVGIISKR